MSYYELDDDFLFDDPEELEDYTPGPLVDDSDEGALEEDVSEIPSSSSGSYGGKHQEGFGSSIPSLEELASPAEEPTLSAKFGLSSFDDLSYEEKEELLLGEGYSPEEVRRELGDRGLVRGTLGVIKPNPVKRPEFSGYDGGSDYVKGSENLEGFVDVLDTSSGKSSVVDVDTGEVVSEPVEQRGNVERYSSTGMTYPCIVLPEGYELQQNQLIALKKLIDASIKLENTLKLYFPRNGQLFSIGGVGKGQLKALIDMLGREVFTAYYSEGYILEGDLIYVLCD